MMTWGLTTEAVFDDGRVSGRNYLSLSSICFWNDIYLALKLGVLAAGSFDSTGGFSVFRFGR